jgi:hypothetical protein
LRSKNARVEQRSRSYIEAIAATLAPTTRARTTAHGAPARDARGAGAQVAVPATMKSKRPECAARQPVTITSSCPARQQRRYGG